MSNLICLYPVAIWSYNDLNFNKTCIIELYKINDVLFYLVYIASSYK